MTEQPIEDVTIEPVDFDDALDSWIEGASLTRSSVPVYGNGAVVERMHEITRQLSEAGVDIGESGDVSLGESGDEADLVAEYADLFEQRESSKAVWVIEDVSSVVDEIRDAAGVVPEPPEEMDEPVLGSHPSEQQKRAHNVAMQKYLKDKPAHDERVREYEKASMEWAENFGLRLIERAVVEIRMADGRKAPGISIDNLRKLRARIGDRQLNNVQERIRTLMTKEPVVQAPFSQSTSEPDPT